MHFFHIFPNTLALLRSLRGDIINNPTGMDNLIAKIKPLITKSKYRSREKYYFWCLYEISSDTSDPSVACIKEKCRGLINWTSWLYDLNIWRIKLCFELLAWIWIWKLSRFYWRHYLIRFYLFSPEAKEYGKWN